jgi:hypothetical protein
LSQPRNCGRIVGSNQELETTQALHGDDLPVGQVATGVLNSLVTLRDNGAVSQSELNLRTALRASDRLRVESAIVWRGIFASARLAEWKLAK